MFKAERKLNPEQHMLNAQCVKRQMRVFALNSTYAYVQPIYSLYTAYIYSLYIAYIQPIYTTYIQPIYSLYTAYI